MARVALFASERSDVFAAVVSSDRKVPYKRKTTRQYDLGSVTMYKEGKRLTYGRRASLKTLLVKLPNNNILPLLKSEI